MRKIVLIHFFSLYLALSCGTMIAQEKSRHSDHLLKDSLYVVNKVKVLNYSLKQFDHLFFEFSEKKIRLKIIINQIRIL